MIVSQNLPQSPLFGTPISTMVQLKLRCWVWQGYGRGRATYLTVTLSSSCEYWHRPQATHEGEGLPDVNHTISRMI